jgi:ACS family hexuronate transporter-like MFS transporter
VPAISSGRAWAITLVATATMAISYLDRQVLGALAPTVTRDLGISEEGYGWLASAFSIAYLVSTPIAGRMLDRVGIRRGLVGAVVVWTIVSAAHALVPGFAMLFVIRLALGAAESPSFPGSAAAIARTLPPEKRTRGMGFLFTGSSFGAMLAPILATTTMSLLGGWRAAFVAVAVIGLLWVPLWMVATGTPAVRAILDGAPAGPTERPSLRRTIGHPAVLRACALVFALSPMFALAFMWGAKLLCDAYGVAQADVGRYLWLPPLLFDIGAVAFGALASRHARRRGHHRTPVALAAIAIAMSLGITTVPLLDGAWAVVFAFGISMAGGAGLFAMLTSEMIGRVGTAHAASAGGVTAAAQSLAYVVASPLIGRGVEHYGGYDVVTLAIGVWILPGALLWLVTRQNGAAPPSDALAPS